MIRSLSDPITLTTDVILIIVKLLVLVIIAAFIRFYNPRIRPDQAFGMFWKTVTIIAVIAVILIFIPLPYF